VTIHLDKTYNSGKQFVIETKNNSKANKYIQSATLNGKPLNKPWFDHADINSGGTLIFIMGPQPNKSWGSGKEAAPPSMTN
jgi:putative alpha-1,2-mannosidase